MEPEHITLPNHNLDSTWEGMSIGPVKFKQDGSIIQPTSALVNCEVKFSRKGTSTTYIMNEAPAAGEGTITIVDATKWIVTVVPVVLPLTAGVWDWYFKTTDAAGVVRMLYCGKLTLKEVHAHDD